MQNKNREKRHRREENVWGKKRKKKPYKEERGRVNEPDIKEKCKVDISVSETDYISYLPIDIKLESL